MAGSINSNQNFNVKISESSTFKTTTNNYINRNGSINGKISPNIKSRGIIPTGTLYITENGIYDVYEKAWADVNVSGLIPTGTLDITSNGIYDVTEKASVNVNVPQPSGIISITNNGTIDVTDYASADVNIKQWDTELKTILDGSATVLSNLPSILSKIKPYAFYHPTKDLPSEYVRLDSTYFGGNSVIFTDIPNIAQAVLNIEAQINGSRSVSQVLYGFERGANGGSYFGVMPNTTIWSLGGSFNFSTALIRTPIQITNTASPMSITATINGVNKTRTGAAGTQTNIMIGGVLDNTNRVTYPFVGTVYGEITAYIGGALKYDYVPVKRLEDNKIGYYDSVNKVFKLPVGSDLIGGEEIPLVKTQSIETADLSVTEIGAYAFYNNDLSSLTLRANQVVTLGENALKGTPIEDGIGTIYVPSNLVSAYQADNAWSAYSNQIKSI